jgi:hypothetical protein
MDMRSQNFTPIDIASKFLTFSIFASLIELGIQHNVRSSLKAAGFEELLSARSGSIKGPV